MTELISQKELMLIKQMHKKKCDICHYWYFKNIGFKYKPYLCNGCHGLMQKATSSNDVVVIYV